MRGIAEKPNPMITVSVSTSCCRTASLSAFFMATLSSWGPSAGRAALAGALRANVRDSAVRSSSHSHPSYDPYPATITRPALGVPVQRRGGRACFSRSRSGSATERNSPADPVKGHAGQRIDGDRASAVALAHVFEGHCGRDTRLGGGRAIRLHLLRRRDGVAHGAHSRCAGT